MKFSRWFFAEFKESSQSYHYMYKITTELRFPAWLFAEFRELNLVLHLFVAINVKSNEAPDAQVQMLWRNFKHMQWEWYM